MIREEKILVGTKEELADNIFDMIKSNNFDFKNDFFFSRDGLVQQLTVVEDQSKGVGIVFYMEKTRDLPEVNIQLKKSYVHITPDS